LDLGVGIFAGFSPSGFVPGGVAGARAWRSTASGAEDDVRDCFSVYLFKDMYAKCEDQLVLSFLFRVLLVIVSPLN
jgi:hypothetical protein